MSVNEDCCTFLNNLHSVARQCNHAETSTLAAVSFALRPVSTILYMSPRKHPGGLRRSYSGEGRSRRTVNKRAKVRFQTCVPSLFSKSDGFRWSYRFSCVIAQVPYWPSMPAHHIELCTVGGSEMNRRQLVWLYEVFCGS